jgi:hypothetical protein
MGSQLVDKKYRRHFGRDLKAASPEKIQVQWSLILLALGAFGLSARDWSLEGLGWVEAVMVPSLAVLCVWPFFQWYRTGMGWLPLGEAFLIMNLIFYGLPTLYGNLDWLALPVNQRFLTLAAVGVFLVPFLTIYSLCLHHPTLAFRPPKILLREIKIYLILGMFTWWIMWNIVAENGWIPDVGNELNVFNSIENAFGSISIVYLSYQMGLRQLSANLRVFFSVGLFTGLIINMASGFLVGSAVLIAAALLAFTLGRKRVPVAMTIFAMALLGFLHLGKGEYRTRYWEQGKNYATEFNDGLVAKYATWFQASWTNMMGNHHQYDDDADIFQRASLLQVLATVMEATPDRLPYLNGITYEILPDMLIPRYYWSDKPRGSLPTEFLAVHYGLQTAEAVNFTSITVGPIAEGWANFGWIGVAAAGTFFGVLFGVPAMLSRSLVPRQVGWLLASVFFLYSVDVSHSIVEVCCSLIQAMCMAIVTVIAVSR